MKKRTVVLLSVVLVLVALTVAGQQAWAKVGEVQTAVQFEQALVQGPGPDGAQFAQRFLRRLGAYLELTEAQKVQLKTILETERPQLQPLVAQAALTHKAINNATQDGEFNEAQIRALAAQQGQNFAALIVEKERVKTQLYQVLTPEQRAKLDELRQRFETRLIEHFLARPGR
jgi:Spy/CpxP family protein refolding chaperone